MQELSLRPAARMITTIGKDLIKDVPASIVELVKNSYDADAENIEINFSKYLEGDGEKISIEIKDDGHGMDLETIKNAWLVPATSNKLKMQKSRIKNRPLQGRKGIGRYAVAILGNYLQMETVHDKIKTIVYVRWDDFEKEEYLEDVRVEVETLSVKEPNGTLLRIIGDKDYYDLWNDKELHKLEKELRKLVSPFQYDVKEDKFEIKFKTTDFLEGSNIYNNYETIIEPLPIVDMYNYRLFGFITEQGVAHLNFENSSMDVKQHEVIEPFKINLDSAKEKYCGKIDIDLRVFDLDTASLESLQQKLTKTVDLTFNRREVTSKLKELTGVGIYRGGFRIRPHGDKGFDWLGLDSRRVQNPSLRIGVDQIIGFVSIQPEEFSRLEEKSARDGLKENFYYGGLNSQVLAALQELETRRFTFRRSIDQKKSKTIYNQMENLFDFSEFQNKISKSIERKFDEVSKGKSKEDATQEFYKLFNKSLLEIKKEKEKEYKEIKQIIALYQGQATLGSITTVVLHEGRKHTSWHSNTLPRVLEWLKEFQKEREEYLLNRSIDRLGKANEETIALIELFDKLDPLTITKKGKVTEVNLSEIIEHIERVFQSELLENNISIIKDFKKEEVFLKGIEKDFRMVFTNLIENSIHWLKLDCENENRYIRFSAEVIDGSLFIDVIDNGPGIKKEFIENEAIFTPGFSAKESGTGLGLAISGEAIKRNNGKLKALYADKGAHLRIEMEDIEIE
ncbi:sensor histidine kinase [Bacillus altitudinis]|uniref:sensor histidine kinase n=1 Tax=Bacillus altitudinis TaxID=293387 RepID=UPI0024A919CC|nr:sensor histidine kinase [Bacillus altitudinis]MDI6648883.1 sensor histidine kinase [Bacillus altitudinis]MDI6663343.1 sensor histidine kinase [Bacillus altitudinis]